MTTCLSLSALYVPPVAEAEGRNGIYDANALSASVNHTAVEKKSGPMKTCMSAKKKPAWLAWGLFFQPVKG